VVLENSKPGMELGLLENKKTQQTKERQVSAPESTIIKERFKKRGEENRRERDFSNN